MSLLLETTYGDLVIDLDVEGSPALCQNVLKLAKARYYTQNLVYNVQPNRFCQLGDPCGDGSGGACIYGLLDVYLESRKKNDGKYPDVLSSQRRFLKSDMGRPLTQDECQRRGLVVATEMNGIADTIGSQLLITIDEGRDRALHRFRNNGNFVTTSKDKLQSLTNEGLSPQIFRSVGTVVEDNSNVLERLNSVYCDSNGRPYADVRVIRALVIDDPFDDPVGMDQLLEDRGVALAVANDGARIGEISITDTDSNIPLHRVLHSPDYDRPPEEKVESRISADDIDEEHPNEGDVMKLRLQAEERLKKEDQSRAVVLEMLGDLPSANVTAPENVLFVCKLNPVTEDEDLELIFSRFDEKVSVDIVRDHKTGASLQYAFVEFTTKDQAAEAYFKMNNSLVDDRRIKVDFSQSVSKVWDRFNQRHRKGSSMNQSMPTDPLQEQRRARQSKESRRDRSDSNSFRKKDKNPYYRQHYRRDKYRDSGGKDRERNSFGSYDRYPDRSGSDYHRVRKGDDCDRYIRDEDHSSNRTERKRDKSSPIRRRENEIEHDSGSEDRFTSDKSWDRRSERKYQYRRGRSYEDRHGRRRSGKKKRQKNDRSRDEDRRRHKRSKRHKTCHHDKKHNKDDSYSSKSESSERRRLK